MAKLDNIWRPEEHPKREGEWLAARYSDDLQGGPTREVATIPGIVARARVWPSEDQAQTWCDMANPVTQPREESDLSRAELLWLDRLERAEEGRMERSTSTTLLALEHRGFAASRAEPGRRQMDRWTITEAGRKALAAEKEGLIT